MHLFRVFIISILGIFFSISLNAQESTDEESVPGAMLLPFGLNAPENHAIGFSLNLDYGSSTLTNDLLRNLYIGGTIENDLIDKNIEGLNPLNRAGYEYGFNFFYRSRLSGNLSLYTSIERRGINGSQFTDDLFELIFSGNSSLKGETGEIGKTTFTSVSFDRLKLGIYKSLELMRREGLVWGGIGFIRGFSMTQVQVEDGNFYTSENGDSIYASYRANGYIVDPEPNVMERNPGLGLSAHAGVYIKGDVFEWSVSVNDLGFIAWDQTTDYYEMDTSLSFTGYNVLDSTQEGSLFNRDELIGEEGQKEYFQILPLDVNLSSIYHFNVYSSLTANIRYRFIAGFLPELQIGYRHSFNNRFFFNISGAGGGYGQLGLRAGLEYRSRNFWLSVDSGKGLSTFSTDPVPQLLNTHACIFF